MICQNSGSNVDTIWNLDSIWDRMLWSLIDRGGYWHLPVKLYSWERTLGVALLAMLRPARNVTDLQVSTQWYHRDMYHVYRKPINYRKCRCLRAVGFHKIHKSPLKFISVAFMNIWTVSMIFVLTGKPYQQDFFCILFLFFSIYNCFPKKTLVNLICKSLDRHL